MSTNVQTGSMLFRCITVWCGLLLATHTIAQTADYRGVMEFQEYCASCHETPAPGAKIPTRAQLKAMPAAKIFESMTVGKMSENARGLSDAQKRRIA